MKTLFVPVKYIGKINLERIELDKLSKKIGLITTVQFLDRITEIAEYLKKHNKDVIIDKGKQINHGQLLGCDVGAAEKIREMVDTFLYIGSGEFHPLRVALKTKKDVFTFNPVTSVFSKIKDSDVKAYTKKKDALKSKLLLSKSIGILVSLKTGQFSYKQALDLKSALKQDGKDCYIFVFDTLDSNELGNFPFIDMWINTACPRIADDKDKKNIIDMSDLKSLIPQKEKISYYNNQ